MNKNIFGSNLEENTFNSPDKSISGSDMFRNVQEILMQSGISNGEARAEANLIITEISGFRIEEILAGALKNGFSEDIKTKIFDISQQRAKTRAPIQHLLGFAYFMGNKFFVDKNVLIPRPETELLVQCAVRIVRKITQKNISRQGFKETINILDIGTGTGCIPIEISKNLPDIPSEAMGVDISTDALRTAIKNMEVLGEQRRVIFRKSDIFSGLRPIDKFDIIVSNPPYIPISARETLQDEVKNFDPDLALFAYDKDGVEFYTKILEDAKIHLKACAVHNPAAKDIKNTAGYNNPPKNTVANQKKSYILFELGCTNGISQAEIVSKTALKKGYKIEFIEKDLSGIERVICLSTKL